VTDECHLFTAKHFYALAAVTVNINVDKTT